MHLVSVFQHTIYLELAIIDLEQIGVPKERILALPLDKHGLHMTSVQASHKEGNNDVDLLFICSMLGMLFGAIYGFVLTFGPVIWGLVGTAVGALVGLLIEVFISGLKMFQRSTPVDVVLIVDCSDTEASTVERILWSHRALGVAKQPVLRSN